MGEYCSYCFIGAGGDLEVINTPSTVYRLFAMVSNVARGKWLPRFDQPASVLTEVSRSDTGSGGC